ncbi:ComF family protein [Nocardia seriolae]|uniref:Phosphoribosyltransferase n=1 Tax=Nocardia seriolae TaxID=37332 RepID=A0A0B8NDW7_9NOCA|nr:phosphoribosyltransferase family protein [Nocardia seriolae]MTJ65768.1 ComF family protein [Nocardia seriolae]MTJ75125.1 ComF family protein [Nocardia seriolae]MTJ86299.1 ComF family protein [Nocardia seriolae]MTK30295.1 ComF family protein [Nocardia seriolae]MTK43766.1 ComF family protein [Nocardia seriolae]
MGELLDLLLPRSCGGCGRAGTGWCADCAGALSGPPLRIRPRADPGVPCWALAAYRGAPRAAVLAVKEHYRWDLTKPLGFALARGLDHLRDTGRPLILVPAPSRRVAARRRGGDPVARSAIVAAGWLPDCRLVRMLRMRPGVRDSVGLGHSDRQHNLHGRIMVATTRPTGALFPANAEVVLIDDVLTTGVTVRESVRALADAGVTVRAALVTCTA